MLVGTGAEHALDPYDARGGGGKPALRPVDPQLARAMLAGHRPPRPRDLVWSFEVGTTLVGGNLVGRSGTFARGTAVLTQAWLSPPHGDVVLHCALAHDDAGAPGVPIETQRAVLAREESRYAFAWGLDESLEPGQYWMTLSIDGAPAAATPFTVAAAD